MSFLKFIFYVILAILVIRFLKRLVSPSRPQPQRRQEEPRTRSNSGNLDQPNFPIEAESVEYEIIEEPEKKDEE